MKVNNINKRVIAGMLGGIMLATPLTLTGCNSYKYVTEENGNIYLDSDKMYPYNDVKDLRLINVKTKINENLYLTYIDIDYYVVSDIPRYYRDVFTGKAIISKNINNDIVTEGIEMLSEESVEQYLISYNMLKESYSVEDLEVLFEKIKQDVYSDNNKELIKNK